MIADQTEPKSLSTTPSNEPSPCMLFTRHQNRSPRTPTFTHVPTPKLGCAVLLGLCSNKCARRRSRSPISNFQLTPLPSVGQRPSVIYLFDDDDDPPYAAVNLAEWAAATFIAAATFRSLDPLS